MKKSPHFKLLDETADEPYERPPPPKPTFEPTVPTAGAWDPRLAFELAAETHHHVGAFRTAAYYWESDPAMARCVASLAVTGRRNARAYKKDRSEGVDLISAIGGTSDKARQTAEALLEYADDANAYLQLGQDARPQSALVQKHYPALAKRGQLPWLAVAPESDMPWRPVNAFNTNHPTFEITLKVHGQSTRTRYVRVGKGDVAIVLLHGLGSRLEEVERVVRHLHETDTDGRFTIFAIDMLNHGYGMRLSPQKHLGVSWSGHEVDRADSFDMLSRTQEHVETFLRDVVKGFSRVVIGGGSLGGTTTFRLALSDRGRSSNRRYVPWSPGSVWNSFLTVEALDEWIRREGVEGRFFGALNGPERLLTDPLDSRGDNRTRDSRFDYLCETYDDGILWFGSNASMWWGRTIDQGLKSRLMEASRVDRREVYDQAFRRTTQGLAREQTYYSVIEKERGETRCRVETIDKPLYLLAGEEDDKPAHIRQCVEAIAKRRNVAGWYTIVPETGHSIHDERPMTLANSIARFAVADWA